MKKLFVFLFISLMCSNIFAKDAQIFGTIKKSKSKKIYLEFYNSPLDKNLTKIEIVLNDKGQFHESYPIKRPIDAYLGNGKQKVKIYLEPGTYTEINATDKKLLKTIVFIDSFSHNSYIQDFDKMFPSKALKDEQLTHLKNDQYPMYCAYIDSKAKEKITFLEEYSKSHKLSTAFIRRQRAAYRYGAANIKASYVNDKAYYYNTTTKLENEDFAFLNSLSFEEADLLSVPEFYEFLNHFYLYRFNQKGLKMDTEFDMVGVELNVAVGLYQDRIKNIFVTRKFAEILQSHPYDITRAFIPTFMANVHVEEYRAYIDSIILKVSQLSSGVMAPNLELNDQNGKTIKLSDYRGKVVYLDFWASWCQPCLKEIPSINQLAGVFEGKDVVFISVSMDENPKAWRAKLAEFNPSIIHVNTPGTNSETAKKFNIQNVPTYFLLDKSGVIIYNNAPAPSDETLKKYINNALKN